MPIVDRNILRLALFELLHEPSTPRPVVIDEALEIAKRFSTPRSSQFINGILDGVLKSRPGRGPRRVTRTRRRPPRSSPRRVLARRERSARGRRADGGLPGLRRPTCGSSTSTTTTATRSRSPRATDGVARAARPGLGRSAREPAPRFRPGVPPDDALAAGARPRRVRASPGRGKPHAGGGRPPGPPRDRRGGPLRPGPRSATRIRPPSSRRAARTASGSRSSPSTCSGASGSPRGRSRASCGRSRGADRYEPEIGGAYHRWIEVWYPDRGYVFSDPLGLGQRRRRPLRPLRPPRR